LKEKEKQLDNAITQSLPFIDQASQQNASIAAYVQLTNRLSDDLKKKEIEMEERLAEKDARIAELKDTIAAKEEIIKALDARIVDLERQLAVATTSDITRFPFKVGVAEEMEQTKM
jgi:chromosome segregation ATPase